MIEQIERIMDMKHLKRVVVCIIYILFIANSTLAGELPRMPILIEDDLKMKTVLRYKELWHLKYDEKFVEKTAIEGFEIQHQPSPEESFILTAEVIKDLGYDFEKTIICYILTNDPFQLNRTLDDLMLRELRNTKNTLEFGVKEGLVSKEALRAKELVESLKVSTKPEEAAALEGFVGCMKTKDVFTKAQLKECIRKKLPKNTKANVDDVMGHLNREFIYVNDQKNTVEILKPEGIEEQYNLLKEYNAMKQKYK